MLGYYQHHLNHHSQAPANTLDTSFDHQQPPFHLLPPSLSRMVLIITIISLVTIIMQPETSSSSSRSSHHLTISISPLTPSATPAATLQTTVQHHHPSCYFTINHGDTIINAFIFISHDPPMAATPPRHSHLIIKSIKPLYFHHGSQTHPTQHHDHPRSSPSSPLSWPHLLPTINNVRSSSRQQLR